MDNFEADGITKIQSTAIKLNLPETVVNIACALFKNASNMENLNGLPLDAFVSASIYVAAQQEGYSRNFGEISVHIQARENDIFRCLKHILKDLEGKVKVENVIKSYCAILDLPESIERNASYIAQKASELNIVANCRVFLVAAAAILMICKASKEKRSSADIIIAVGEREDKVHAVYALMYSYAKTLLPEEYKHIAVEDLKEM